MSEILASQPGYNAIEAGRKFFGLKKADLLIKEMITGGNVAPELAGVTSWEGIGEFIFQSTGKRLPEQLTESLGFAGFQWQAVGLRKDLLFMGNEQGIGDFQQAQGIIYLETGRSQRDENQGIENRIYRIKLAGLSDKHKRILEATFDLTCQELSPLKCLIVSINKSEYPKPDSSLKQGSYESIYESRMLYAHLISIPPLISNENNIETGDLVSPAMIKATNGHSSAISIYQTSSDITGLRFHKKEYMENLGITLTTTPQAENYVLKIKKTKALVLPKKLA